MKKLLLFAGLLVGASLANAQQAIPNGAFEQWNTTTFDAPRYYIATSNRENFRSGLPFNVTKVTDAYHGTSAVKITTVANATDSMFGYMFNGMPEDDPSRWHGGIPISEKPSGFRGYIKSDVKTGDTAYIVATFSKNGVNIGAYFVPVYGQKTTYTLVDFDFTPALPQTPDSMMFGAVSSNALVEFGIPGSYIQMDSFSLKGITTQPAQLNGDFELWDVVTVESPLNWYTNDNNELSNVKSTDPYKGSFAVKLTTRWEQDRDRDRAQPDRVSTGYYPRNCNPCNQLGGYPFTNLTDTLVFWYKYTAAGGSKAEVRAQVKKNGSFVGGNSTYLDAAATYTRHEMPFSAGMTPDTLVIEIQSSRWEDSLQTNAGAVLIIDEVQLKSKPLNTGLSKWKRSNTIGVYPNPANTVVNIDLSTAIQNGQITLINMVGQAVSVTSLDGLHHSIDIQQLPKGIYFYEVVSEGNRLQSGKLIIQ